MGRTKSLAYHMWPAGCMFETPGLDNRPQNEMITEINRPQDEMITEINLYYACFVLAFECLSGL